MNIARTICFALLCIGAVSFAETGSNPNPVHPLVNDPHFDSSQWFLNFSDEFSGNTVDRAIWDFQNGPSNYNNLLCSRWEYNAVENNGMLRLNVKQGADPRAPEFPWTTASVLTKRSFLYGYYEARFRNAQATGTDNAFWIMPYAANDYEIDINEGRYDAVAAGSYETIDGSGGTLWRHIADRVSTNIHTYWGGEHLMYGQEILPVLPPEVGFHTFGLLWTETELVWYVDGREARRRVNDCCHNPGLVRFAVAIPREWAGPVTKEANNKSMDVDYVRVFKMRPRPIVEDPSFDAANWKLTYNSDFNGNVDNQWLFRVGADDSNNSLTSRRRENAVAQDGQLKLTARHESNLGKEWTSASARTKDSFLHGYIEARYRYAGATGTDSTFWLMPANADKFEIDINRGRYQFNSASNLHVNRSYSNIRSFGNSPPDNAKELLPVLSSPRPVYHVFGLLWSATELVWYRDGKEVRREPNLFGNSAAFIRLSLDIPATGAGLIDPQQLDGKTMDVDYVRVYQYQSPQ